MWATCVRTVAIIGGVLAWVMPLAASADDQCRIQISQPVMDFGVFNSGELTTRTTRPNMVSLGKRQLQLSVTCPDPVRIAVTFHGMASGAGGFRMGDMGEFTLTFKDARLDGSEVLLGRASRAEELPLKVEDAVRLLPNSYASPVVSGHLGVGRVFTRGRIGDHRLHLPHVVDKAGLHVPGAGVGEETQGLLLQVREQPGPQSMHHALAHQGCPPGLEDFQDRGGQGDQHQSPGAPEQQSDVAVGNGVVNEFPDDERLGQADDRGCHDQQHDGNHRSQMRTEEPGDACERHRMLGEPLLVPCGIRGRAPSATAWMRTWHSHSAHKPSPCPGFPKSRITEGTSLCGCILKMSAETHYS